jgi:hypothetical protein
MELVYGQEWNEDLRFMIDVVDVEKARKRFEVGPWFSVAAGAGLYTSADDARAAGAGGVALPVPEFSVGVVPGPTDFEVYFYDEHGSITIIHQWRAVGDQIFFHDATFYIYPEAPRHYVQNESSLLRSVTFKADGTNRETITEQLSVGIEPLRKRVVTIDRDDVPLDDHYLPIPEFGDWAALGRRDRYVPSPIAPDLLERSGQIHRSPYERWTPDETETGGALMGLTLYYTAERDTPLTDAERAEVTRLVAAYPLDKCADPRPPAGQDDLVVARYTEDLAGEPATDADEDADEDDEEDLGEALEFYPPAADQPQVILHGSVQPPSDPQKFVNAVNYWCELLAKIRIAVPGAQWVVSLDDNQISWNETQQRYYLEP